MEHSDLLHLLTILSNMWLFGWQTSPTPDVRRQEVGLRWQLPQFPVRLNWALVFAFTCCGKLVGQVANKKWTLRPFMSLVEACPSSSLLVVNFGSDRRLHQDLSGEHTLPNGDQASMLLSSLIMSFGTTRIFRSLESGTGDCMDKHATSTMRPGRGQPR